MNRLAPNDGDGRCLNCGCHVTERFRAAFGDEDDVDPVATIIFDDPDGRIVVDGSAGT